MFATTYRSAAEINSAMGRVYGHMSLAIITSMIVSYFVGTSPALLQFFFGSWVKWLVIFAPLAFIFAIPVLLNAGIPRAGKVLTLHAFAGMMGLSFATIFAVYTMASIVEAFLGGAILFGVMGFYGYFTKQSLDSLGKYLLVGLIAIIIASIINIFVGSTVMQMIISAVAIVIFLGLTAYDTQQIREMVSDGEAGDGAEISGAITLYLDFINIFLSLLNLFGDKKE
jgi:FtsH-binding integral membrane protein